MQKKLKMIGTVDVVIEILGGTGAVARLTRRTHPAVSNWRRAGAFPSATIYMINGALELTGYAAPPKLFRVAEFKAPPSKFADAES